MKKNNLKEKIWLDIKFSVIAFLGFIPLYFLLSIIIDWISASNDYREGSFLMVAIVLGHILVPSLFVNILIQLLLNLASEGNKIKSYLFFVVLNIDTLVFGLLVFDGETCISDFFIFLLFFIIPILIKYLITRYYYKKLQKITFNEKINH